MPRRPSKIERDIPLYLIAGIVKRGVSTYGEGLERVIVRKTGRHFYNVSIRTRRIRKELRSSWIAVQNEGTLPCDNENTRTCNGDGGVRE